MTLNDLVRKASSLAMQLSSGDVPLTFPRERLTFDYIADIKLEYHEEGPHIEVKLIGELIPNLKWARKQSNEH